MNISEITHSALKEPTLLDALSTACIWEAERAIQQAKDNDFREWETCFKHTLKHVYCEYLLKQSGRNLE